MEKDRSKYDVNDFLMDESFIDWVRGSEREDDYWSNFIINYPEKVSQFEQAKKIIANIQIKEKQFGKDVTGRIKQRIDWSITAHEKGNFDRPVDNKFKHWRTVGIAATLLLAFILSVFLVQFIDNQEPEVVQVVAPEFIEKTTQKGQKLTIYLNDGSKVLLNYDSKIRYPYQFSESSRIVELTGEAFFEVVPDKSRPFQVVSGNIVTQVVGTSFNVNAFPENDDVEVALLTGKIVINKSIDADEQAHITLVPGQAARFVKENNSLALFKANVEELTAWKDGIIRFKAASQQDVFNKLNNWYGIEIKIVNRSAASWNYTGQFDNLSLENILTSLSFVKNFEYEIENNEVKIRYNN